MRTHAPSSFAENISHAKSAECTGFSASSVGWPLGREGDMVSYEHHTYSMADKSISTSSPVQSGIFFFLFLLLLEWHVRSARARTPSTCSMCLKVPSSSWIVTNSGPKYFRIPFWFVASCFTSSSTVFLNKPF